MDAPTPADRTRITLVYHAARLQLPAVNMPRERFDIHLERAVKLYEPKAENVAWATYLDTLYAPDLVVAGGCLDGLTPAWEQLFAARTGRTDVLLVDALRARAVRLYPRDDERQETAVAEFWSGLIVPDGPTGTPVLARFDGQRPLAPWLIRVFQNLHLSRLRRQTGVVGLPDDDIGLPLPAAAPAAARWHEAFSAAARDWLDTLDDTDRLLLGLRWRYRLSQRDAAAVIGVHEGTLTRRTDKLRDRALEQIGAALTAGGWAGDDLRDFVLTDLGGVLTDDPRLTAAALAGMLKRLGKAVPEPAA